MNKLSHPAEPVGQLALLDPGQSGLIIQGARLEATGYGPMIDGQRYGGKWL